MLIKCCKDCQDRHPKCHSECEKYNAQREQLRKEAEKRLADRLVENALIENINKTKDRWRRGHK